MHGVSELWGSVATVETFRFLSNPVSGVSPAPLTPLGRAGFSALPKYYRKRARLAITVDRNGPRAYVPRGSRIRFIQAFDVHFPPCPASRSEEHTSELQSLMRISYAVFCL